MNRHTGAHTLKHRNKGGIFLFISFLLPVLLFAIVLVVEVTTVSFGTNALQSNLDSAVLSAAQRLPNVEEARKAFSGAFGNGSANGGLGALPDTVVAISPDSIEAKITRANQSFFGSFFGIERSFSTAAHAKAILPPLTVAIALDTSSYTAPSPSGPAWPSSNLPPASLFIQDEEQSGGGATLSPLQHTQSCFNSVLLPLKRLAVQTVASLEEVPSYRLSAVTFPTSAVGSEASVGVSKVKGLNQREPDWVSYDSLHRSNGACAAAALHDTLYHLESPYRFPKSSRKSNGGITPDHRIVDMKDRSFNPRYAPFLSVEEVLWSQAAREGENVSTVAAIESLGGFVISEHRSMKLTTPVRGKHAVVGLLFAGDIPRTSTDRFPGAATKQALLSMVESLVKLAVNADVNLYLPYILFQNDTGVTIEEGNELSSFLSTITASTPQVRMPVFMTRDSATLEAKLLPLLKNLRKPIILSQ